MYASTLPPNYINSVISAQSIGDLRAAPGPAFRGSVNFFLARACLLTVIGTVKIAIKALDESKGAKFDFQDLMKDLYNLERVLFAIQQLNITDPSNPEYDALQLLKETEKY